MELTLKRIAKRETYTIGHLYVNGVYFADTVEDKDRGLKQDMALAEIKRRTIASITAIPTGTYKINMNTISPKYSKKLWYMQNCNGARVPRLENVPAFEGVLIHTGNYAGKETFYKKVKIDKTKKLLESLEYIEVI